MKGRTLNSEPVAPWDQMSGREENQKGDGEGMAKERETIRVVS